VSGDSIHFNPAEVSIYYAARTPNLRQTTAREWRGPCPIHDGHHSNFAVDRETGRWFCHSACGRGGDIIGLERELTGADFKAAKAKTFHLVGRAIPNTPKPDPMELQMRWLVRREAEQFAEWTRRKRIETAALLRDLDRYESDWRGIGQTELASEAPVSEIVWNRLHMCFQWSERTEQVWRRLFNFESNAGELYREFSREREAA
jgi:hypothetical protein